MNKNLGPYRNGKVHVLAAQCSTCIFRPGNLMHLKPGVVAQMVRVAKRNNSVIPCHDTYNVSGKKPAVCRGFYDRHPIPILRLAKAMGVIEEIPCPPSHLEIPRKPEAS